MQIKPDSRLHTALISCQKGLHHPAWMPASIARLSNYGLVERYKIELNDPCGNERYRLTAAGRTALAKLTAGQIFDAVEG